jgi:hypothetical protein
MSEPETTRTTNCENFSCLLTVLLALVGLWGILKAQ